MIANLPPTAMFVWAYYQMTPDPDIQNDTPQAMPDYSRYAIPFTYSQMEVFPATDAREWSAAKFTWRRIGIEHGDKFFTVMIWEGNVAESADIVSAQSVLASITVN